MVTSAATGLLLKHDLQRLARNVRPSHSREALFALVLPLLWVVLQVIAHPAANAPSQAQDHAPVVTHSALAAH